MKQTLLIPLVLALTTACGQSSNNNTLFHNVYHYAKAVNKTTSKLLNENLHSAELMTTTEPFAFTYNGKQISSNDLNEKEQFWQAARDDLYEAGGPGIPTCPNTLMPVVEVQVNNTASDHDDYGSTTNYTACRARIVNYSTANSNNNYPGGVPVELRNPAGISQNLIFSSTGGSSRGAASVFTTLPEDGSWLLFYIEGKSTNTVDKSSIIEVATSSSTCDEVVVARKALMIGTSTIEAGVPQLEIEVGSISTLDDYVTWSPKSCRIRWSNASQSRTLQDSTLITYQHTLFRHASYVESPLSSAEANSSTLTILIMNMTGTDRLRFADENLPAGSTASNRTLTLSLNSDGSWVYFYIAGNFGNASINDKDAVLGIKDINTDQLLTREAVMVRVRKNANSLTTGERDRYLQALKKTDLTYNDYIDFVKTHNRDNTGAVVSQVASRQAHKGSAFLPWHRAFLLDLERLLQTADPSVAIPYWKFDANAPNIFKSSFMGSNSTTSSNMVVLASTNPIVSWTLPGENVPTGIQRKTPYGDGGHPAVATETATLGLGSPRFSYSAFKTMEVSFHNPAHSKSGSASWITSLVSATRDPLFFLLHCNVDHIWAKWQWMRNRYDVKDSVTYDLQGSFYAPAPGVLSPSVSPNRTLGQYVEDTMWPWDNITGGTSGSAAERPHIAILTPLPSTIGAALPGGKPTISSVIDYISKRSNSPDTGLGYDYDDFYPY